MLKLRLRFIIPALLDSRLGALRSEIKSAKDLEGLEGLHFHTMCQQGADVLERTVAAFEKILVSLFLK
jgi:carboxynorspermidine decarboxylase